MTFVLGVTLGTGLLLLAAPFLWPRRRRGRGSPLRRRMHDRLTQAGLDRVTPAMVVTVSAVLGLAAGCLAYALLRVLALAVAAFVVGAAVPAVLVSRRARQRRRATRVVWPDVVDQLVSAVRSGLALPDAVVTLASVGPAATRESFARFGGDYRATGNFSIALDALKVRLADPVADRILETLRMSRDVGGSELTTVLRNLGAYLRQETAIRSEVEARQSWVLTAARLGVAAPWIVLLLLSTRPEASAAYNSAAGSTLIVVGLVVSAGAYRVMLRLGRLPEERRWFA